MSYYKLNENSPAIKQPIGLNIKLRPHQLTSISAMLELEKESTIIIDKPEPLSDLYYAIRYKINDINEFCGSTFIIETNTAILADKVGSGKTYMIIGLILAQNKPQVHNRFLLGTDNFSIRMMSNKLSNNVNLIAVPHNLANQWGEFMDESNLSYLKLNTEADFDIFFNIDYVNTPFPRKADGRLTLYNRVTRKSIKNVKTQGGSKSSGKSLSTNVYKRKSLNKIKLAKILDTKVVIVLNINRYRLFKQIFPSELWSRVIIDEMDSANIPSMFDEVGNFNWFMTATPTAIFQRSCRRYVSRIFGASPRLLNYFTVKNTSEYIDQSITLPKPNVYIINTLMHRVVSAIQDLLPKDVINMINAGNMKEAITKLNCNVNTGENIVTILTGTIKTELSNLLKELKYVKSLRPLDTAHDNRIKTIETSINRCKTKLSTIEDRISSIKGEMCIICAGPYVKPTISYCCKNIYCFECLMNSLLTCNQKCPMCRTIVNKDNYSVIDEESKPKKIKINTSIQFNNLDKSDVLEHVLKYISTQYVAPKILIFSDYRETFNKIIENIKNAKLEYAKISGIPTHITNVIDSFDAGDINILLLDSSHYGSGLNLQSADFVILYHRMSAELETQIIGRAHRFGRKTPLSIIYLVNDNEDKTSILSNNPNNINTVDDLKMLK